MKHTKVLKNVPFVLTVLVNLLLLASVFVLMNYVQRLLDADVKINLTEIVTQNKDVITSKLMLEVNNLDLIAKQLSDRITLSGATDSDHIKRIFLQYVLEKGDDKIYWADLKGHAAFSDGAECDISGRKYFRLALEGTQNISERTVSRRDGEDIFVISVPLKDAGGEVVGTVQKQYTPQEMYDICSVSLFSKEGYMYIINDQGYILISSQTGEYSRETDNYYRLVYQDNPEASNRLAEDIKNNRSGFMETVIDGQKVFSAYTAVNQIFGWYLISSVATSAVSPNASIVIKLFYFILMVVVAFFGITLFYFRNLKNRQQNRLKKIAFVDPVTSGDAFAKFTLDLEILTGENPDKQFCIFTFDIDNFKYINSFYGFEAGDRILRSISEFYAKRLTGNERIARMYSDHFVLLLEDASEERLAALFDSELDFDNITVYLSAGLYPITNLSESVNLMADKANMAAQKIKGRRYKRVEIYSEDFDRQMIYNEQLKRSVEQALADDEIIPFFQPKVNINDRAIVGAEALARWRTKEGKLIPPGDFISVCEKTGLIVMVDMAIFEKTLQFLKRNLELGVPCVPISVNFSRTHLLNKEFVHSVLELLNRYKVPPGLVELELTETAIFDNYQLIEDFIKQLHENGLQISMDDFGSGYSSLHMLKDVDIDVLKIDRGFLMDTASSDRQQAVFAAIAQMAEQLKIKVVVEGVENLQNVALMQRYGCSIAQGYYYAKPMDEVSFEKLYQDGKV